MGTAEKTLFFKCSVLGFLILLLPHCALSLFVDLFVLDSLKLSRTYQGGDSAL